MSVCVCVRERERERMCECVCVCNWLTMSHSTGTHVAARNAHPHA